MLKPIFDKVAGFQLSAFNFIKKENPTQVFSTSYYEVFKNTYFEEYLQMTASGDLEVVNDPAK